jgi:hypothetical protein
VDKVRMMKIYLLKLLTLFLIIYSLDSCHDPIFYTVTQETPLIPPLIDGSPSNFVEFKNEIYVASGKRIWKYGKNEQSECKWSKMNLSDEKLGNYIASLAKTDNSLYVHYLNKNFGGIRRFNENGNSNVVLNEYIQTIYASANVLFICTRKSANTYTIYYLDDSSFDINDPSGNIKKIEGITSMLNGVAYDSNSKYYYLCTSSGIFYMKKNEFDSSSGKNVFKVKKENEEDKIIMGFTGIINLNENSVAAIKDNGDLYEINDTVIAKKTSFNDNRESTGALAIWFRDKTDTKPSLLLVGRDEYYYSTISRYTNGYVEIALGTYDIIDPETDTVIGNKFGILPDAKFNEPGKVSPPTPTTIDNYERYVSSLGKKIINYFIQAPFAIDPDMTLFASTHKNGVWSYRDRYDGEGITWNAER